jgi:hypothetical protein
MNGIGNGMQNVFQANASVTSSVGVFTGPAVFGHLLVGSYEGNANSEDCMPMAAHIAYRFPFVGRSVSTIDGLTASRMKAIHAVEIADMRTQSPLYTELLSGSVGMLPAAGVEAAGRLGRQALTDNGRDPARGDRRRMPRLVHRSFFLAFHVQAMGVPQDVYELLTPRARHSLWSLRRIDLGIGIVAYGSFVHAGDPIATTFWYQSGDNMLPVCRFPNLACLLYSGIQEEYGGRMDRKYRKRCVERNQRRQSTDHSTRSDPDDEFEADGTHEPKSQDATDEAVHLGRIRPIVEPTSMETTQASRVAKEHLPQGANTKRIRQFLRHNNVHRDMKRGLTDAPEADIDERYDLRRAPDGSVVTGVDTAIHNRTLKATMQLLPAFQQLDEETQTSLQVALDAEQMDDLVFKQLTGLQIPVFRWVQKGYDMFGSLVCEIEMRADLSAENQQLYKHTRAKWAQLRADFVSFMLTDRCEVIRAQQTGYVTWVRYPRHGSVTDLGADSSTSWRTSTLRTALDQDTDAAPNESQGMTLPGAGHGTTRGSKASTSVTTTPGDLSVRFTVSEFLPVQTGDKFQQGHTGSKVTVRMDPRLSFPVPLLPAFRGARIQALGHPGSGMVKRNADIAGVAARTTHAALYPTSIMASTALTPTIQPLDKIDSNPSPEVVMPTPLGRDLTEMQARQASIGNKPPRWAGSLQHAAHLFVDSGRHGISVYADALLACSKRVQTQRKSADDDESSQSCRRQTGASGWESSPETDARKLTATSMELDSPEYDPQIHPGSPSYYSSPGCSPYRELLLDSPEYIPATGPGSPTEDQTGILESTATAQTAQHIDTSHTSEQQAMNELDRLDSAIDFYDEDMKRDQTSRARARSEEQTSSAGSAHTGDSGPDVSESNVLCGTEVDELAEIFRTLQDAGLVCGD